MAKMGLNGSSRAEIYFEDCRLPHSHLLAEEGQGFKVAMTTLDYGRIGIASQVVRIFQGALTYALNYARQRQAFGQPITQFQGIQFLLADLATRLEAVQILGAHGYMKEHPVERMRRDAKASQIYEGINQLQRLVIARRLLAEHVAT